MNQYPKPYWSIPTSLLLQQLQTTAQGLTSDEALLKSVNDMEIFAEVEPD